MENVKKYYSVEKYSGSYAYQHCLLDVEMDSIMEEIDGLIKNNRNAGMDKGAYGKFCELRKTLNRHYAEYKTTKNW